VPALGVAAPGGFDVLADAVGVDQADTPAAVATAVAVTG